jgi:hypothetical protein
LLHNKLLLGSAERSRYYQKPSLRSTSQKQK